MAAEPAGKPACKDAAEQLALCIEQTPCVKEKGGSIMECLKAKDVGECEKYRTGYYHCRRQQLDMRTRIRGRKFADHHASAEDDKS